MRRVVVTGLGLVTPLACGVEESWAALLAGKSTASLITRFRTDDLATRYACQVPRGDGANGTFNPDQWVDPKEQRRMDDFIIYGLAAAAQAVKDSGWEPKTEEDRQRWRASQRQDTRFYIDNNPGYPEGHGMLTFIPINGAILLRSLARFLVGRAGKLTRLVFGDIAWFGDRSGPAR